MTANIHPSADVQSSSIGLDSNVWQYCVILPRAIIGRNCNICSNVFIENDVLVGDNVTIKNGVQLWDGVTIEDNVFIGPNATFTNDLFPRSKAQPDSFARTIVQRNASIGANATILPNLTIGSFAMIGAGAVVTRSVPPYAIVVGNPAVIVGYADTHSGTEVAGLPSDNASAAGASCKQSAVRGVARYSFSVFNDIRGSLSAGEFPKDVPFIPKRYFCVFNVPNQETRGEHAHHSCEQFLICIKGTCSVVVDDGSNRQEYLLNAPNIGIYIPPLVWGLQYKYSADAVLLVFASHAYDNDDYIREYPEFLKLVGVS